MKEIQDLFPALSLGKDGIWYGGATDSISYPEDANDEYFGLEETSYWFQHRNNCIIALVNAFPPTNEKVIFDIGGGNGFVCSGLMRSGYDVALIEPGPRGARNAKSRGVKNVICSTLEMAGGAPGSISNVGLFDVLEHIEHDALFLSLIAKMMSRGGRLYMTVPAFPVLWSHEDAKAGHFRRYRMKDLRARLHEAGFSVIYSSTLFRLMPIPIFIFRTLPSLLGIYRSDLEVTRRNHSISSSSLRRILAKLFTIELEMIQKKTQTAVGGSLIVAAELAGDPSAVSRKKPA